MWLDALMGHIYLSLHQLKMRQTMLIESQSTALMCRYTELHAVYNGETPHSNTISHISYSFHCEDHM
jgi:hypothetical protein